MALDAFGNCDLFVVFPVIMGMDISVALGARHPFFGMYTGIVLRVLLFVAPLALYLLDFDFLSHVFGEIGNVHVATGAGILAMDRCSKIMNRYLVAVATQAGGRVNGHSLLGMCGKNTNNCQGYQSNESEKI
jgi:hypothetical protein